MSIEALKKEPGFEDWNPDVCTIERPDLEEVQKMDNFISEFKPGIDSLKSYCEKGDKILLNVSSGTPAMKYSLQLLSTQDRDLLVPVQVDTPLRACNTNIKEYSLDIEWACNEDNEASKYSDRCNISTNDNLFIYLLKENITALIKNYDYSGALTIAKSIETDLNNEFLDLLEAARQRLALNYRPANTAFKKYGYKMLFNETGDTAKLYEYILYLNIKLKTYNYIEFTRGITPIFEDLLYYLVKDKVSPYIKTMRDNTPKWDVRKLLSSTELGKCEFVQNINPNPKYSTLYIKSDNLIDIIEKYEMSDAEVTNSIAKIRDFERQTRNKVAHEIKSLDSNNIKTCEEIFNNILELAIKENLIKKDNIKNFLGAYDDMNKFLLSKLH